MRTITKENLKLGRLVFGGNVFGWTADEHMSLALLDRFVAGGFNSVDTSDAYSRLGPGTAGSDSERIIGNWVATRGSRAKLLIATKVGFGLAPGQGGLSKKHIVHAAEQSLRRLNTDYIDLYQSHIDDATTPIQETLEAYAALIKAGKVRAIGASNFTPARLMETLRISTAEQLPRYEVIQALYNLYDRAAFENELATLCKSENLGVLSYFSLASGFLTGKYRSEADLGSRARASRVRPMLNERGWRILAALDAVSARCGATVAQISLAWLLAQEGVDAALVSATSIPQLEEIMAAADLHLDAEALGLLAAASDGQS